MKKINKFGLILSLVLIGMNQSFAGFNYDVPEMDANIAVLGLGLLAGVMGLVSEYRRKK